MTYPDVRVYLDMTSPPMGPATSWVDVSSYVTGRVSTSWGRSSARDEFSPGGGSFTLINNDGRFDPFNASGPYYPNLKPGARVKIEATMTGTTVTDSFTSPSSTWDPAVWSQLGSGGVAVSGGNLAITNPTTVATRGLQTIASVPFIDTSFAVGPITTTATPANNTFFPLALQFGASESATWRIDSTGTIRAYKSLNDPFVGIESTLLWTSAFNAGTHGYMRIRRVGSLTSWDTSPDGVTWTTRYSEDVGWADPLTCQVQIKSTVIGAASAATMTVGAFSYTAAATHPVAYGWCQGFPQQQIWKARCEVPVRFYDSLTRLARSSMPDSVLDYRMAAAGAHFYWKLGGDTAYAEDSSGTSSPAVFRVQEREDPPTQQLPVAPDVVVAAGQVEPFIPMSGRPGTSWAKMYVELGQPLGGTGVTAPRTPVLVEDYSSTYVALVSFWSFEVWVQFRQAFPLTLAGGVGAATTPIKQPLMQIGVSSGYLWWFGVDEDGNPRMEANAIRGGSRGSFTWSLVSLFDGEVHHLLLSATVSGGSTIITLYVDGVSYGAVNMGDLQDEIPSGWPLTVGFAEWVPVTSLQSTIGDVAFYFSTQSSTVARQHWNAGKWGSLSSATLTGHPTSGSLITDALTMIGWSSPTSIDAAGQIVKADVTAGRGALEYLRTIATSERGPLWQEPDGTLTFWNRNWSVAKPRAKHAQWRLADDGTGTAGMGYSSLDFDISEDGIITEAEVSWSGGKQRSESATGIDAHGRLRESVDTNLETSGQAKDYADWLVYAYGAHQRFVKEPLVFEPNTAAEWSFALGARFGTRVTVVRTTADGRSIEDDLWVQALSHEFEAEEGGQWTTSITFEPADEPARMWTWGESTWGGPDVFGC